jgi:hypothetical protein
MKKLHTALMVVTGLAVAPNAFAATPAAFADSVFIGRNVITGASSACATTPLAVTQTGSTSSIVYKPQGPGQAGPDSLAIFDDDRAMYIEPNTGGSLNGSGLYKAVKIAAGAKVISFVAGYKISLAQSSPAVIYLTGTISNYWDVSGCTITFEAALGHKPND